MWFFWTLPVLLQRWFSTCLMCVHTLIPRESEKGQSPEYFKIFEKNTIFNEHPVATGWCTIILAWSACNTCLRWSGNNYSTHCSYTFSIYICIYVHELIFIKRNLFIKEIQAYIHSNMYVMRDIIMIYRYRYRYREREREKVGGRERVLT